MNNHFFSEVWKYCPYCGAKSFHPGDDNYMQCDSCNKKFFINASGAVACIIENAQGEILFTRRAHDPAKGMLDLPGGFVSPDETAEEAVRREVKEELNLDVVSVGYIGSSHNRYMYGDMMYYTLDLGFKCLVADFAAIHPADDVSGYEFLPHNNINMQEISFISIRNLLQLYLKDQCKKLVD